MKKIIFALIFMVSVALFAQKETIGGLVTDDKGLPLVGVTIVVKNTKIGTITDFDGNFKIEKTKAVQTLVFSYIGFETKEIRVSNQQNIKIVLETSVERLDELVLVGYGSESKKNITSAIASVEGEDLVQTATTNFDQALAGRVSGVVVSSVDGTPGEGLNIVIRGGNSITGDNSPLYVVDGIPLEDFDPASISTSDIEEFDILKDASATAIYGSRGANGIIIINTKRGRTDGKTSVNVRARSSVQWIPNRLEVLNPYQYVKYQEGIAFALDDYVAGEKVTQFYNIWGDPELYRDIKGTSWQDEIFRMAQTNQYNFSLSGGTKESSIYLSSEYLDQEGTLINTGFKKIIHNLKVTQKINEKAKLTGQIQYSIADRTGLRVSEGGRSSVIRDAIQFRPVEPINDDGLLLGGIDPDDVNQRDFFNPVKNLENTDRTERTDVIRGNYNFIYNLNKKLSFKSIGNYQVNHQKRTLFFRQETQQATNTPNGINGTVDQSKIQTLSTANTINYKNRLKKNRINLLAGMEIQSRRRETLQAKNSNIPTDLFGIDKLSLGTSPSIPQTSASENRLLSYFGRVNYSYDYKYLFTAIFRADGSSKFNKENQWGYFPSFSVAWRLDREKFIKDLENISTAKLRVGWGRTGNNRIGDFDSKSQLNINNSSGYIWGDSQTFVPGAFQSNLGVPDLKWETTDQLNIGLDFGFFDNRIEGTIDYYNKQTTDLLLDAETALHTGFERVQQNVGEVENQGIEFSLNTKNINRKKFKWETSFNIAFNRNKVLALNRGQSAIFTDPDWSRENVTEFQYITRLGEPVGMIYGLQYDGLYQAEDFNYDNALQTFELKEGIPDNGALPLAPGSVKFVDQNGDGTINEEDRVIIGNPHPKHYGGLNNSFQIGNFDIGVLLQWSYDFDILNANRSVFTVARPRNSNGFVDLANAWTPTNTDTDINTTRYLSIFGRPPSGNLIDNRYVEDGSYLRLQTLSIGYSLPKKVVSKLKMKSLKLSVIGQNLYTWTNYSGYNPDVSVGRNGALSPNLDWSSYPQSITVMGGINVIF